MEEEKRVQRGETSGSIVDVEEERQERKGGIKLGVIRPVITVRMRTYI